jgi:8-hydroxy-5-deazaflavin:NADPH oxidoreductase
MNFGVIGPGDIGEVIIRKLRDAGYPVKMANSRGPESLKYLATKTGGIPASLEQVVQDVDMLFIVVPQKAIPELPKWLLNRAQKETIVIDVGNYYPFRDGPIDELENGLTESVWVERQIGRPVVKALNTIPSKALMAAGRPAGSRDRVALPISGDNTKAKEIVAQLIDRIGFESVDAGTIVESCGNSLERGGQLARDRPIVERAGIDLRKRDIIHEFQCNCTVLQPLMPQLRQPDPPA